MNIYRANIGIIWDFEYLWRKKSSLEIQQLLKKLKKERMEIYQQRLQDKFSSPWLLHILWENYPFICKIWSLYTNNYLVPNQFSKSCNPIFIASSHKLCKSVSRKPCKFIGNQITAAEEHLRSHEFCTTVKSAAAVRAVPRGRNFNLFY